LSDDLAEHISYYFAGDQGYDTHRIWEALLLGAIPIVEANPFGSGIEKAFSRLPVLVVPDLLAVRMCRSKQVGYLIVIRLLSCDDVRSKLTN
jgi:hypothetical protein